MYKKMLYCFISMSIFFMSFFSIGKTESVEYYSNRADINKVQVLVIKTTLYIMEKDYSKKINY